MEMEGGVRVQISGNDTSGICLGGLKEDCSYDSRFLAQNLKPGHPVYGTGVPNNRTANFGATILTPLVWQSVAIPTGLLTGVLARYLQRCAKATSFRPLWYSHTWEEWPLASSCVCFCCLLATSRLPLDGLAWSLIEDFLKICPENSSFI